MYNLFQRANVGEDELNFLLAINSNMEKNFLKFVPLQLGVQLFVTDSDGNGVDVVVVMATC